MQANSRSSRKDGLQAGAAPSSPSCHALDGSLSSAWSKSHRSSNENEKKLDGKSSYRSREDTLEYIDEDEDDNVSEKWKPQEWSDDVRMNALFAPFRNRDLNPLHFDNKLKFWKELVLAYCHEKNIVQLDARLAEQWFTRKNVKPKCLDLVLAELAKEKRLVTRDEALRPVTHGIIHNVLNRFIWNPLSWSTNYLFRSTTGPTTVASSQLSTSAISPLSSPTRSLDSSSILHASMSSPTSLSSATAAPTFVFIDLLESKASQLLKTLQSQVVHTNVDCVLDYEQVRELADDKDLDLVVGFLEANKKVLVDEHSIPGKKLLKFTLNSNRHVSQTINEIELSFIKLKEEERKLEADVNRLNSEIENLTTSIKVYLKQGNKSLALKLLKKRKLLEKSVESKDGILSNVQTLIMNIEQADTHKLTYDIFSKGVSALKEAQKGISLDQIDETIGDLNDIIAANAEIEDTLSKPAVPGRYAFDESELNLELNELLAASESNEIDEGARATEASDSFDMDELLKNLPAVGNSTLMSVEMPARRQKAEPNQATDFHE